MITIFANAGGLTSMRQAEQFFKQNKIPYQTRRYDVKKSSFSREELMTLVRVFGGIEPLLNNGKSRYNRISLDDHRFQDWTFSQMIDYVIEHPRSIKSCFMVKGMEGIIGYNSETIRQFLPKGWRTTSFRVHLDQLEERMSKKRSEERELDADAKEVTKEFTQGDEEDKSFEEIEHEN
jgi:arsenate reductase-like glutaredoxin family protein